MVNYVKSLVCSVGKAVSGVGNKAYGLWELFNENVQKDFIAAVLLFSDRFLAAI